MWPSFRLPSYVLNSSDFQYNLSCNILRPSEPAPQRFFPVDLNQFDCFRRALYVCADGNAEVISSIDQLTDLVYDRVAASQHVRLSIKILEDDSQYSVHLMIE